ncbi:MAG: DUF2442 domain-containing protein [Phaeodactylibacter sp.]|nr:DUF2442 domain-containing protein [Phaeodactylibacter sp.]
METYPTIKYIEPLSDYRLFIIFDNGIIKIYSMKEKLQSPPFQPLQDAALFNQAHAGGGGYGVIWNDRIDLSEYELWKNGIEVSSVEELAGKGVK